MRIIFAGTPDFAAASLRAIAQANFDIPLVLTQPDRPKGRGMQLQASPVKQAALELNLRVIQPETLRHNHAAITMLQEINADVMVVAAYGLILPQEVLTIPKYGCLNIHASLLPRWRGAAPIQRAIEAGDTETGICIMQMDTGLDTGAIISEHRYTIKPTDTALEVHNQLMQLGADAIVADLQKLAQSGKINAIPQPKYGITYAQKLSKEEAQINWQEPAELIVRKIRAFNPTPTAWTNWEGKPIKIWQAYTVSKQGIAGKILSINNDGIVVATAHDAICITELQPSGSKRMTASAFSAGRKIQIDQFFE